MVRVHAKCPVLQNEPGKDRALLENWRPISLVNVDTKIMSKVIAARITRLVMLKIVSSVKQYVLFSILWILQLRKTSQVYYPAFDSVEWEFLIESLKCFFWSRLPSMGENL